MPSARSILYIVTFCGFAVNYMTRINVNIAIVSMVYPPKNSLNHTYVCYNPPLKNTSEIFIQNETARFDWDEKVQNYILGGFYWLHWLLQIPGGILARTWGTKLIFGLSNFISALLCLIMPIAAYRDYRLLVVIRVLQGLITGVAWPSMHNLTAQWIPPNERSKFVSTYLGSSIGVALTYPLCGFLMEHWGWESVYYVTGGIGVIWYIAWVIFVYDSPAKHPRIKESERKYIETNIGKSYNTEKLSVPWAAIFSSTSVWMTVLAQWGSAWGLFTLITQAPTYFKQIIGLDETMTGVFSGVPHLVRVIFSIGFAIFADHLLSASLMTRTNVRKLSTAIALIGQGLLLILVPLMGCDATAAIVVLILAVGLHGAVSSGPLTSLVDISPNFAGVTQGFAGTLNISTGTISAYVVGLLTYQEQTLEQWRKVYFISAAILIFTGGAYVLFAESEIEEWNTPKKKQEAKELKSLNEN